MDDDWPFIPLNDTGIVWGGNSPSGNNITCTSNMIFPVRPQDCTLGRDATHNDDSDGHAGFSFTKLSNSDQELSFSAPNWTCVKDNVTGLVWEVKQNKDNIIDPAIDTTFFPNTKSDSFWSASPSAEYSYAAWHVHFGSINTDAQTNRDSLNHVRLVRSRQ